MNLLSELQKYSAQVLSTQVLLGLLKTYKRPYDKIAELVQQGYLIQIRKGLYVTSLAVSSNLPESFLIANHLIGPSYISIDSALHFWGLIPERVYEITSVTTKLSKRVSIQNQIYSYSHLPINYYPLGIRSVELTETQTILIASPEKSICDKVITTAGVNLRSKKQAMIYMNEELRIEKHNLRELNLREMNKWLSVCQKANSINNLIQAIDEL